MPENTVYVGRPSRWGNRWRVDSDLGRNLLWDAATVVEMYRIEAESNAEEPEWMADMPGPHGIRALRGKNLACWCPLDQPCHADVLLDLANR